jgi:osmotically-inducible protein OsmY
MISLSSTDRNGHDRSLRVAEAAKDLLRRSPYWTIRSVACECQEDVLILRGHLPSFYQKQLAQEAVAKVEGVSQVVNETVVDATVV